jgi:hypothetical protein
MLALIAEKHRHPAPASLLSGPDDVAVDISDPRTDARQDDEDNDGDQNEN